MMGALSGQPLLVEFLCELIPYGDRQVVADRVGIHPVTMRNWFKGSSDPRLSLFEASLNAVGYRLEIVPLEDSDGSS